MQYPFFDSNTLLTENNNLSPEILEPIALLGKRRRANSLQESTTGDSSDGNLSDSSRTPERYYPVDLPMTYIAVKNLLHTKNKLAGRVGEHLKSLNKNELRRTLSSADFFNYFTESEFELLYRDLKTFQYQRLGFKDELPLTLSEITAFFKMRFDEIQKLALTEWADPSGYSTNLYIPGKINEFYLSKLWALQLEAHVEPVSYNKTLDFIIKRMRPENWATLMHHFTKEFLYAPSEQILEIISECVNKKYSDLMLYVLSNTSVRSREILEIICTLSYETKIEIELAENFVHWIDEQPRGDLLGFFMNFSKKNLAKILGSRFFAHHIMHDVEQAQDYKKQLRSRTTWFLNDEVYVKSVAFFKKMANFLQQAMIWSTTKVQDPDLADIAVDYLIKNPLLNRELPDFTGEISPQNLFLSLFKAEVPRKYVLALIKSLSTGERHGAAQLWPLFITSFEKKQVPIEEVTQQINLFSEKFGLADQLPSQVVNDCLGLFLRSFECCHNNYQGTGISILFESLTSNNAQLELSNNSGYAALEKFLSFMALSYNIASEEVRKQQLAYFKNQEFMSTSSGLTALYLMVKNVLIENDTGLGAFETDLISMLTDVQLLKSVPFPTAVSFIQAYERHLSATLDPMRAQEAFQQLIGHILQQTAYCDPLHKFAKNNHYLSEIELPQFTTMLLTSIPRYSPLGTVQVVEQSNNSQTHRAVKIWTFNR